MLLSFPKNRYRHEVKMNHRQYMDQTTANTTTTRTVAATNNNNNNNNAQYVPCTTGSYYQMMFRFKINQ